MRKIELWLVKLDDDPDHVCYDAKKCKIDGEKSEVPFAWSVIYRNEAGWKENCDAIDTYHQQRWCESVRLIYSDGLVHRIDNCILHCKIYTREEWEDR